MISVILLAGGIAARMGLETPKQFLPIQGKAAALHSFDLFLSLPEVSSITVVSAMPYRSLFQSAHKPLRFADPGSTRQQSLANGLKLKPVRSSLVCVHDAARPMLDAKTFYSVLEAAQEVGASAAAVPVKNTIKQTTAGQLVAATPDRSTLWEVHTPQIVRSDWLLEGIAYAEERGLSVTDDVSLVELIGKPVKLALGSYKNIKITVPEDLDHIQRYVR